MPIILDGELEELLRLRAQTRQLSPEDLLREWLIAPPQTLQERIETLGNNLPSGAIYQVIVPPKGRSYFVYFSHSVEQVIGVSAAEIIADANALYSLIHPDDIPKLRKAESQSLSNMSQFKADFRLQHVKTDKQMWISARSMPRRLPNGDVIFDGLLIDISDQKLMEQSIKRNQRLLRETEQIAQVGGFTEDLRTHEIIWTQGLYQLNDIPPKTEITPETIRSLYTPQHQERLAHFIQQIIENRLEVSFDIPATTWAGKHKWLHISAHPIIEGDQVVAIQGIVQDITARKNYEDMLRQSHDLLDTLGNHLPAGAIFQAVYSPSKNSHFQYISPSVESLLGISAAAIMENPRRLYESVLFEDAVYALHRMEEIIKLPQAFDHQMRHLTPSGEVKWIQYRAAPRILPSNEIIFDGIMMDVTEQKHLENELRRNELFLKKNQSLAQVGGWEIDFTTDTIQWSDETYAIYEVPLGTPINRNFLENLSSSFSRGQLRHARRMAQNRQTTDLETQITTPSGKQKWLRVMSEPRIEGEQVVGVWGMVQDITVQKLAQAHELQLQVEQNRVKILADFVQNIGHEFRTPLTIINSSLDLLLMKAHETEYRNKHAERIREQAQSILTLVEDLTTLVRLDSGSYKQFVRISIPELLAHLRNFLEEQGKQHQIEFHTELSATILKGNDEILPRAFEQVIINALHHTPLGGKIRFSVVQTKQVLDFSIEDSGSGMSPEILERAFERFYRGNQAHTTRGFGLGLAIAQKTIELHNGKIYIESQEGLGTNVHISLPLGSD